MLVGNRDLNKLRYTAELSEAAMLLGVDDVPGPHWDASAPSLRAFIEASGAPRRLAVMT